MTIWYLSKGKKKALHPFGCKALCWRSGWDSNPRVVSDKLISSQPRYDRFDTAPHNRNINQYTTERGTWQAKTCRKEKIPRT